MVKKRKPPTVALTRRDWGVVSGVILGVFLALYLMNSEGEAYARGTFLRGVPRGIFMFVNLMTSTLAGSTTIVSLTLLQVWIQRGSKSGPMKKRQAPKKRQ